MTVIRYLFVLDKNHEVQINSKELFLKMHREQILDRYSILLDLESNEWRRVEDFPDLKKLLKLKRVSINASQNKVKKQIKGNFLNYVLGSIMIVLGYSFLFIMAYFPKYFKLPNEIKYLWGFSTEKSFLVYNLIVICMIFLLIFIAFPKMRKGTAVTIFGLLYVGINFTNFAVSAIQGYEDISKGKIAQREMIIMAKDFGLDTDIQLNTYTTEKYGERIEFMKKVNEYFYILQKEKKSIDTVIKEANFKDFIQGQDSLDRKLIKENIEILNKIEIKVDDFEKFLKQSISDFTETFETIPYEESEKQFARRFLSVNLEHIENLATFYRVKKLVIEKQIEILKFLDMKNTRLKVKEGVYVFRYKDEMDQYTFMTHELQAQMSIEENIENYKVKTLFDHLRTMDNIQIQVH